MPSTETVLGAAAVEERAAAFVTEVVIPHAEAMAQGKGPTPDAVVRSAGEYGLAGLLVPTHLGGAGADHRTFTRFVEAVALADASSSVILDVHLSVGTEPLLLFGTSEQLGHFLPAVTSGACTTAFCLTEPGSGSDARAMTTRAVRDGHDYRLSGTKAFITNSGVAGLYVVMARHGDGPGDISAFIVDGDAAGLSFGEPLHKMGLRGSRTAEVYLDGVRVPASQRLGNEGDGFRVAMAALDSGRVGISAQATGIAQGCLDAMRSAAAAGRTIDQAVFADAVARTAAARRLTAHAATLADAGMPCTREASVAKLFATDAAVFAAHAAVEQCAPDSAFELHPASVRLRDAKACQIYEGTNQVQRIVIARTLLAHNTRADKQGKGSAVDVRLNDEQELTRQTVRDLARDRIAPRAREIDATGEFPWDVVDLYRSHDLFALPFPPEYGGLSGSALTLNVAIEEVAKACATSALIIAVQALGGYPIMLGGTDEQKARLLPSLASGEKLAAYALTEPGAGSDPGGMETKATRQGDEYVLSGSKIWITDGGVADTIVVFAKTDPAAGSRGVTAFVLENARETKGFTATPIHGKLGIRGSNTAELHFDEVVVPAANRLGEEGSGFGLAMRVLDRSRPGVAAQALGIAQGALDYAVGYAKERRQFGKAIADFQAIQFMIADMEAQTAASRALVYWASQLIDDKSPEVTHYAAMAKLVASDTAMRVTTDAVQILGGYGYVNEYPVERMMRDAKITQIYEGTNQVQRLVISRQLLKA